VTPSPTPLTQAPTYAPFAYTIPNYNFPTPQPSATVNPTVTPSPTPLTQAPTYAPFAYTIPNYNFTPYAFPTPVPPNYNFTTTTAFPTPVPPFFNYSGTNYSFYSPTATPVALPTPFTPSPSAVATLEPTSYPTSRPTPFYRSKLYFERTIAVSVNGFGVDAWSLSQASVFKSAIESAFSAEVAPDDVVELLVILHSQIPTLQPTPAVRRRLGGDDEGEDDEGDDDDLEDMLNGDKEEAAVDSTRGIGGSRKPYLRKTQTNQARQQQQQQMRKLATSVIDLDVTYSFTIISAVTSVTTVTNTFNSKFKSMFVSGGISAYLTAASSSLGVVNNATILSGPTSNLLSIATGATVLVLNTASPSIPPTPSPSPLPSTEPTFQPTALGYFGLTTVVELTEGVAMATAAVVGASVAASVGTSVGASVGASVGSSVGSSTGASVGTSTGTTTTGTSTTSTTTTSSSSGNGPSSNSASSSSSSSTNSGTNNAGGDPMALILLVQGIAITAKLSSLPDSYAADFAESFSMFNLQVCWCVCSVVCLLLGFNV
jgi:hypothetical protein